MKLQDFDFRIWSELENGYVGYPALAKCDNLEIIGNIHENAELLK
ncbi:hypothetical protein ATE51_05024 (plasmid) [Campylobacter coli]|nr:hypothetical protein [Campylobacter coli]ALV00729.1 hypothetical protein ATE51_05024 [Campylobacter coli]